MKKIKLNQYSPSAHPLCKDKTDALRKTAPLQKKLYDLLYLMFAHNQHSLLIILQGIDTSGKDGTVRHIFAGANPQGLKVFSFKRPTTEEFRHDFLWRCHLHTPESGLAAIFNRSYYEDVTTAMVHPKLLKEQHIPSEILKRQDFFEHRYDRINDFEKLLAQKGTVIVKFLLNISKKEQQLRINERLQNRSKNWKFSKEDVKERKHWNEYMSSFEKMLSATSTKHAPWIVVPADNKWYRDYIVSQTLVQILMKLKMSFPKIKN
jgi:PPK2 family polyphosphate:nucleotide phosphotransferase